MRHRSVVSLALLALACLVPSPARATWPLAGVPVSDAAFGFGPNGLPQFAHLLAGPAGGVVAAAGFGGGIGQHWYVQRMTLAGALAPGWPTSAVSSGGAFMWYGVGVQGFTVDAAGTWWHAWRDGSLFLQAVHADASTSPALPAAYEAYGPENPRLAPDGAGGVYLATRGNSTARIRLQRLLADGSSAPGWNPRGRLVGTGFADAYCHLLPDGSGGVVIAWPGLEVGGSRMRALRFDPDSTVAAGWPEGGIALGAVGVGPIEAPGPPYDMLLTSGPDHFIAGWTHTPAAGNVHVYLQRFGLDGTLDPSWPASGLEAVTPGDLSRVTLVPDGSGGVHVLWEAAGIPLTTHVSSGGGYVAGHDAGGVPLVDAGADYRPQTDANWGNHAVDRLAGATGSDGGLIFAWPDFRTGEAEVRVRWLLASGLPDPAEATEGRIVSGSGVGNVNAAVADGAGGAYVSWWQCLEAECNNLETRLTRAERSDPLDVEPHAGGGARSLSLRSPYPNPAQGEVRFRVWLPGEALARLQLLDVSGRVLRSLEVRGAGEHVVALEDLGSLAPGIHFATLVQGGERRHVRLAIAR